MKNQIEKNTDEVYVTFKTTKKEIRDLGCNLGYGLAMGVFSATFTIHMIFGIAKAIARHTNKKVDSVKEEPKEDVTGEAEQE